MNKIISQLKAVASDLDEMKLGWALVGGLAVGVHSEPRNTRDIDLVVVSDTNEKAEDIVKCLIERGYANKQILMQGCFAGAFTCHEAAFTK